MIKYFDGINGFLEDGGCEECVGVWIEEMYGCFSGVYIWDVDLEFKYISVDESWDESGDYLSGKGVFWRDLWGS